MRHLFTNPYINVTSVYEINPDYLKSPRWKWIRAWRLWLDDYQCRTCHRSSADILAPVKLEIHHASYRWFNRWYFIGIAFELMDTITLCKVCHGAIHRAQPIREFRD